MPFSFPRIDVKINMQGIANVLQRSIGVSISPTDLYEVYNTARDPSGQPYWAAVNYGTPIKYVKSAGVTLRTNSSVSRREVMIFWASGIKAQRVAAGNPAFHMKERTQPLVKSYFRNRVSAASGQKIRMRDILGDFEAAQRSDDGPKFHTRSNLGPTFSQFGSSRRSRSGLQNFFLSIMEDTMDFAIEKLADFTPTIKPEYYAEGYTPESGQLKDSYVWKRLKDTSEIPEVAASSNRKRATLSRFGRSFRGKTSTFKLGRGGNL